MTKPFTVTKHSRWTITFHWLVALVILGLIPIGYYMTTTQTFALYPLHKSVGTLALVVILARVIWRIREGWPQPLTTHDRREIALARATHWILLVATVGMPVSGVIMGATSGHGVAVFGVELFPRNPDPANPNAVVAFSPVLDKLSHWIHEWLSYVFTAAIIGHVVGALKHHFLDRDSTLRRMTGFSG